MKFLITIYLIIFGRKIGIDKYNNIYYEVSLKSNKKGRRFVIYKGLNEPTKVPPEWESWLRYSTKEPITHNTNNNYFLPNLTGTIYKHLYTRNFNTKKIKSRSLWQGNKYDIK